MATQKNRQEIIDLLTQCGGLSYQNFVNLLYSIPFLNEINGGIFDSWISKFTGLWNLGDANKGKYDVDYYVTYGNKIYRSIVNNNTAVPGTNGNWVIQGGSEINAIGLQGIASPLTNPGVPAEGDFWIATEPGTYVDFSGVVLPASSLGIIYYNGTDWEISATTINLAGYATKSDLIKLIGSSILPKDMTTEVFPGNDVAGADPNYYFGEGITFVTPETPFRKLFIKTTDDNIGDFTVGFIVDVAGVGTVVHSKTVTIPAVGYYEYTADDLEVPDLSTYEKVYVLLKNENVDGNLRPFRYKSVAIPTQTAQMNTGTNAFELVTLGNYIFNYWIEVGQYTDDFYTLSEITRILKGESIETAIKPEDRSGLSIGANRGDPAYYFGEEAINVTPESVFEKIFIKAPNGGNVKIAFIGISGTVATKIHEKEMTVPSAGVISFTKNQLEVPDLSSFSKLYVMLKNNVGDGSTQPFAYTPGTGTVYLGVNATTMVAEAPVSDALIFNYWIETTEATGLAKKVEDLEKRVDNIVAVSTYAELIEQLASGTQEIVLKDGVYVATSTIQVPAGRTIRGTRKAIFRPGSGVTEVFSILNVDNVVLHGFTVDGQDPEIDVTSTEIISEGADLVTQLNAGNKTGVYVRGTEGTLIESLFIHNFNYAGLRAEYINPLGGHFGRGFKVKNCHFEDCYFGFMNDYQAEYSTHEGISATRCLCGVAVLCGNVTITNSQFTENKINAYVGTGPNNSHGSFIGCLFNHANKNGIYVTAIDHGFIFTGCQFFDGVIEFVGSRGGFICDSIIASKIVVDASANRSVKISNCFWKEDTSYETGTIEKTGAGTLLLSNNDFMDGRDNSTINGVL